MIFTLSGRSPVPSPRIDRRRVHHDAGLVVGRTPPEETPVALGGFERRALPRRGIACRLHVMVRIEQKRRLTRCFADLAVHIRMGPFDFEQLHLLETSLDQERGGFFGARAHHGRIKARERHARHPDQRFEVGEVGLLFFGESPEGEVNRHAGWIAPPGLGPPYRLQGSPPERPCSSASLPQPAPTIRAPTREAAAAPQRKVATVRRGAPCAHRIRTERPEMRCTKATNSAAPRIDHRIGNG